MRVAQKSETVRIAFNLNGREVHGHAEPRMLLTDFLRQVIGATGTHVGCEHGVCGCCTVRIDGVVQRACLVLAIQAEGRTVETVEGLAGTQDAMTALQEAFRRHHALQCGFCTPGILISLTDLLEREPDPDDQQIRDVVSGHLCRCTGYAGILAAARDASRRLRDVPGEGR